VLLDYDRRVNCQPVTEQNQECVQPALEVVNANDREHDVDDGSDDADEWPRDSLNPGVEGLCGESEGIHVRDVVCDNPESEDDETELTETTSWIESCAKKSTDGVPFIAFCEPGC